MGAFKSSDSTAEGLQKKHRETESFSHPLYMYIYGRVAFELLSHRAVGLRFLVRWLTESS